MREQVEVLTKPYPVSSLFGAVCLVEEYKIDFEMQGADELDFRPYETRGAGEVVWTK